MRTMIFDIEVLRGPDEIDGGWENPQQMGFGTAIAWDSFRKRYLFYGPDNLEKLEVDLAITERIIGFNHMRFDYRVMRGNLFDYQKIYEEEKRDLDLLIEVIRKKFPPCQWVEEAQEKYGNDRVHNGSISLDGLAEGTFGLRKSGHGSKAPILIQQGKWAEVFEYNLQDVRLTRMLYEHWINRGFVIDRKGNVIRNT